MKLTSIIAAAAVAIAGFLLALVTAAGCAGNCAGNCPPTSVWVSSENKKELNGILTGLDVNGEACPPRSAITCQGDRLTTTCDHVLVEPFASGTCDVLFEFSDRPSEILRLKFGVPMNANGSCCKGYPVQGPSVYTIPAKPTGPIYSGSVDAGTYDTDAVVVLTDGGADAHPQDGGSDAADAGADAGDAGP